MTATNRAERAVQLIVDHHIRTTGNLKLLAETGVNTLCAAKPHAERNPDSATVEESRTPPLYFSWRSRNSLCESDYIPVRVLDCELAHSEPLRSERHDHLNERCDSRVNSVHSIDFY